MCLSVYLCVCVGSSRGEGRPRGQVRWCAGVCMCMSVYLCTCVCVCVLGAGVRGCLLACEVLLVTWQCLGCMLPRYVA